MRTFCRLILPLILLSIFPIAAKGQTSTSFKVIHDFGAPGDGMFPSSGMTFDKQGNLYGVTGGGGDMSCARGCGTVYELKSGNWNESVLYSFGPYSSGGPIFPGGGLAMDAAGNLYGVTGAGGANNQGTVFELTPNGSTWTETTLYSFCSLPNCADGSMPTLAPVLDSSGNLYGATSSVLYELTPGPSSWTEKVLHTFCSQPACADGRDPQALVRDSAGNFYGSTGSGGSDFTWCNAGCGVVFALKRGSGGQWQYQVLYDFQGAADGEGGGVVVLHDRTLYGVTQLGGSSCSGLGCGTIFALAANNGGGRPVETVLHSFGVTRQGLWPEGAVGFDPAGNLYGTTYEGGNSYGVVFAMMPETGSTWQYQVIYEFHGGYDGANPQFGVITDGLGHVYGTTSHGGYPYYGGVVFQITP